MDSLEKAGKEKLLPNHDSPIWEVYDLLRSAKLNDYYYTSKSNKVSKINLYIEIFLAITVPTSAIAGLPVWKQPELIYIWLTLISVAAFFAVAKPFLRLQEKAQIYTIAASNYRILCKELDDLRSDIVLNSTYDRNMLKRFQNIRDKLLPVAQRSEPIEAKNDVLIDKLQERVNKEIPVERLLIPENSK